MLQWLRRVLSPSHDAVVRLTGIVAEQSTRLDDLERQLKQLKASELDREATTTDTILKLERMYKRIRQRQVFDERDEKTPGVDPITELVLKRRRGAAGGSFNKGE